MSTVVRQQSTRKICPVNRNISHLPLKCDLWSIHVQTRCAHRPGHVLIAKVKELVAHAADVTRKNAARSPNQGAFKAKGRQKKVGATTGGRKYLVV